MGVDEQRTGVLTQQLDLAVGLGLRAGEPVAVHVEAVEVLACIGLPAVGILDRQQDDDGVVEDLLGGAVGAVGQLVQHAQRRVGAGLLAAVHVGRHPEDRRVGGRDGLGLRLGGQRVTQLLGSLAHALQARRAEPFRLSHDREAELAPLLAQLVELAGDHPIARSVHRVHVLVGLVGGDLASVSARVLHHVAELGRGAREDRCGLNGIAGLSGGWCHAHGGCDEDGENDQTAHVLLQGEGVLSLPAAGPCGSRARALRSRTRDPRDFPFPQEADRSPTRYAPEQYLPERQILRRLVGRLGLWRMRPLAGRRSRARPPGAVG